MYSENINSSQTNRVALAFILVTPRNTITPCPCYYLTNATYYYHASLTYVIVFFVDVDHLCFKDYWPKMEETPHIYGPLKVKLHTTDQHPVQNSKNVISIRHFQVTKTVSIYVPNL